MKVNSTLIKLPGLIDVHVHLREPGATQKEDFTSGSRAAVAGGYTQVLDMPNNTPPTVTPNALKEKINLASGKIWCDLGFNFGATAQSTKYFKQVKSGVFGLKLYMGKTTGPLLIENENEIELIFKSWQGPLPIMIHAHDDKLQQAISMAKKYKKKIHICHITTSQIQEIVKAKKYGIDITCEVTPHHLFLNDDNLKDLGSLGIMKPPLLSKRDQEMLWNNIDQIDMIATDHAPHTLEEKRDEEPMFGVPGLETTLPLMLSAVFDGALSLAKLVDMMCFKPRMIFRLPEQRNTYSIVDVTKTYKIKDKKLFTKCKWTPFVNQAGRGEIKKVVLRGKTVFADGKFTKEPIGKIMKPRF